MSFKKYSDDERAALFAAHSSFINDFENAMLDDALQLYGKGIRFHILGINGTEINAVLLPCCGSNIKVTKETRSHIENKILSKTNITKVIWEA